MNDVAEIVLHLFIIKSTQQTCTQDYYRAVENKHLHMNKNKNNKNREKL